MRFITRRRRQPPAIIIVALIDILIVLLIFVMATTTLKRQQPRLRLALPESSQAKKAGVQEKPPLVVTVEPSGSLRLGPEREEGTPVTAERLKGELVAAAGRTAELTLAIRADTKAPVGQIIKVMDAAKEANIKIVNLFTEEKAKH
jgi:biopolymer transport protein ExbD